MSDIRRWSLTAANNNFAPPDGFPENMARSEVNNAARELMRAVRAWYDDPEWLALMVDTSGDLLTISKNTDTVVRVEGRDMTSYFPAGRRIRMSVGGSSITYGHVVSAALSTAGHTDVTVENMSGAGEVVPAGCDTLDLHHSTTLGKAAFQNTLGGFYFPASADSMGLQDAIDEANTAGGGIVAMTDASYAIDTEINLKSDVVMMGVGPGSTSLVADASLAGEVVDMSSRSTLLGVTIDASSQSSTNDAVRVATNATEVLIQNVRIESATNSGIRVGASGNSQVFISDVWIIAPDLHGIFVEDGMNNTQYIVIDRVFVSDPGAGSTNDVAAVHAAGRCSISNIHAQLDRASPKKQRGVKLASRDIGGDNHARRCTVTNVVVEGTGDDAIAVEIGGEHNAVSNVTANLSGNNSRGILIDNEGAGQVTESHLVSNVTTEGVDVGVFIEADADDNLVSGCNFVDCQSESIIIRGERNRIYSCYCDEGGSPSIEIQGNAANNEVSGCTIKRATTGTGIDILTTADSNLIRDCSIDQCATGIQVATGATDNIIVGCLFRSCTTNVSLPAEPDTDDNLAYDCHPEPWRRKFRIKTSQSMNVDGAIPEFVGIQLPGPLPDGSNIYRIQCALYATTVTDERNYEISVHLGSTGTVSDTAIYTMRLEIGLTADNDYYVYIPGGTRNVTDDTDSAESANEATSFDFGPGRRDTGVVGEGIDDADASARWSGGIFSNFTWGLLVRPTTGSNFVTISWNVLTSGTADIEPDSWLQIEYIGDGSS